MHTRFPFLRDRRGTIVVLSAFLLVFMIGMIAFAVDIGVMMLTRSQLQIAADSAAMAGGAVIGSTTQNPLTVAQQFAAYHKAGGATINLASTDFENGTWDTSTRSFTPSTSAGNAVRVTARANSTSGGNKLFFARIFGVSSKDLKASAVAMGNPRDICFVVDLSGSMNNDTEPCWAVNEITDLGYGTTASSEMQSVFTDFGFGTYPGTTQWVGYGTSGFVQDSLAYARLTSNSGPLTSGSLSSTYRILSGDSEATRKTKAYKWIIDKQLAVIMPSAKPTPSSSTSLNYWTKYLDYILENKTVNSGTGTPPSNRGSLPPSQDSDRIDGLGNPDTSAFSDASSSVPQSYRNKLGYLTYVQFMMDYGRDIQPDGATYTPLSTSSSNCPYHSESTAGGSFNFPPREQPTHAARRALIAAIAKVKTRNQSVSDTNQKDWVSIVTFDTVAGSVLRQSLTSNYDTAMQSCTTMQAVSDTAYSTATESGMILAYNHIKASTSGGSGRINTQKVVVLLTDGMANLYQSPSSTISSYRNANASANWYGGSSYSSDAAMMQSMTMQAMKWKVYSAGLGFGCDSDFMNRMARMGGTADNNGNAPVTTGNPATIESELTTIFNNIITNPSVRLVQ